MIRIKTIECAGLKTAIHAMRNPYNSWGKSDTQNGKVGKADKELSERLSEAGTEHCKHLRLCIVWAEVEAPLYWWKEFDTYRMGVEKVSCSTMHTIHNKPFERSDFSIDYLKPCHYDFIDTLIERLNHERENYILSDCKNKEAWWQLIQLLPSSYNQKRTVMMSYAALRQICKQRRGHKLTEWYDFRKWAFTLPESWMIGAEKEGEESC